jgi:hypothetical protein
MIPRLKTEGYSADGIRVYPMGGGGSSSPAPAPQNQTVTQTNIPEYARPYVETMLGATQQQLFNTAPNASGGVDITGVKPYQPYSKNPQDYIAGFSPMQQQAMTGAANMKTGPEGFQQDVGGYMNPYLQQSLAPQLAEANRQYDISGMQANAQATQAGAFGGGRQALMQSENERNRNMGLQNIVGQGYNTAFNNAQNQYNTGVTQGIGINQLQAGYGAQQQAQQQNIINQGIQNYATAQQYPQQQLAFMNSMLRGLPLQTQTVQGYQAAPSNVSQLAGLGTAGIAGLGLYNAMNR